MGSFSRGFCTRSGLCDAGKKAQSRIQVAPCAGKNRDSTAAGALCEKGSASVRDSHFSTCTCLKTGIPGRGQIKTRSKMT